MWCIKALIFEKIARQLFTSPNQSFGFHIRFHFDGGESGGEVHYKYQSWELYRYQIHTYHHEVLQYSTHITR